MNTQFQITVKDVHVDQLGHLNHVYAVQYLELARDEWYARCGLWEGRSFSAAERLGTVVVNINIDYRLECFLDETLSVKTSPQEMGTRSFVLAQKILREDGEVAIEGRVTSVIMDLHQRKVIPVPECLARYLPARNQRT